MDFGFPKRRTLGYILLKALLPSVWKKVYDLQPSSGRDIQLRTPQDEGWVLGRLDLGQDCAQGGLVKTQGKDSSMVLTKVFTEAKNHIPGAQKKFDSM